MCKTAIRKSFLQIAQNELLRRRLDDASGSMRSCLDNLWLEESFRKVAEALMEELSHLNELLGQLESMYLNELPLESEEPVDIDWKDKIEGFDKYKSDFVIHQNEVNADTIDLLTEKLEQATGTMKRIAEESKKVFTRDQYISYGKRSLRKYSLEGWNAVFRDIQNNLAVVPDTYKREWMQNELKEKIEELKSVSKYSVNAEKSIIYYDALGRHLWNLFHKESSKRKIDPWHLLELAKSVDYYSSQTDAGLVFLDRVIAYEDELDCMVDNQIKHNAGVTAMRLGFCNKYFTNGFSQDFVLRLMNDLLKSEHSDVACEKLKGKGVFKFIHQLAGVFARKMVFVKCEHEKIIAAIKNVDNFGKASDTTKMEYMRKRFNDARDMEEWIERYIDRYRKSLALACT